MSDTPAASARLPRLTASETAARLGVKPETLYAYVSRGLLGRVRGRDGSSFDPLEVEEFARRRRAGRNPPTDRAGRPTGAPLGTIEVDLALIEDDELYYRGRPAVDLADLEFEAVCRWVWGLADDPAIPNRFQPPSGLPPLPAPALVPAALDRIHLQVVGAGAADPLRHHLDPAAVTGRAGPLLAAEVEALPRRGRRPRSDDRLSERLWSRLTDRPLTESSGRLLDAALVLLLDHDLAASTMAVRVAASARAHPYAAVAAGLGAFDSALHGNASRAAYALLDRVIAGQPLPVVLAEAVATSGLAGFGHRIYRTRDPRAEALIGRLADFAAVDRRAEPAVRAYRALSAAVTGHTATYFPNVDLALAALAHGTGMDAEAGTAIFAIGRTAGWLAHVLQEYREPPLRLRPVGRYAGP